MWEKSKNPDDFYQIWDEYYAILNTCANVSSQLTYFPTNLQKFVKYRIDKYHYNGLVKCNDAFNFNEKNFCDGLLRIDVLEHIENSSEVFIERISPMLKKGGLLIMKAPWRGQLTHIDEAADDFYNNGGKIFY